MKEVELEVNFEKQIVLRYPERMGKHLRQGKWQMQWEGD